MDTPRPSGLRPVSRKEESELDAHPLILNDPSLDTSRVVDETRERSISPSALWRSRCWTPMKGMMLGTLVVFILLCIFLLPSSGGHHRRSGEDGAAAVPATAEREDLLVMPQQGPLPAGMEETNEDETKAEVVEPEAPSKEPEPTKSEPEDRPAAMPDIPRVFHQIWFPLKGPNMPIKYDRNHRAWKEMNPEWEVRLWTHEQVRNLIAQDYPCFLPTYDSYEAWVQRTDAARYFILHKYGGVYADLDYSALVPLETMLRWLEDEAEDADVWCNLTKNAPPFGRWFSQSLIFSRKGASLWKIAHRLLVERRRAGMWLGHDRHILLSTGPGFMDALSQRLIRAHRGTELFPLPTEKFNPCGGCDRGSQCTEGSFAVHELSGTWKSGRTVIDTFLSAISCDWPLLSVIIILATVLLVVLLRDTHVPRYCGVRPQDGEPPAPAISRTHSGRWQFLGMSLWRSGGHRERSNS